MAQDPGSFSGIRFIHLWTMKKAEVSYGPNGPPPEVKLAFQTGPQRRGRNVDVFRSRQSSDHLFAIIGRPAEFAGLEQSGDERKMLLWMALGKFAPHHEDFFRMSWIELGRGCDAPANACLHGDGVPWLAYAKSIE